MCPSAKGHGAAHQDIQLPSPHTQPYPLSTAMPSPCFAHCCCYPFCLPSLPFLPCLYAIKSRERKETTCCIGKETNETLKLRGKHDTLKRKGKHGTLKWNGKYDTLKRKGNCGTLKWKGTYAGGWQHSFASCVFLIVSLCPGASSLFLSSFLGMVKSTYIRCR